MKNNTSFEVYSKGSNSDLSRTVAECISLQRKIVNFFKEAMHTVQSICACVLENLCGQNYNNKGMNAKSGLEIVVCIPEKSHIIATINNIIIIHAHRHNIYNIGTVSSLATL